MGKGSTTQSSRPTFRSGNIVTPPNPRVTERKGTPVDFVAPQPLTTVTSHDMNGFKIAGRESLGTERANATPQPKPLDTIKAGETFILRRGKAHAGVVRTVDMGDDSLPTYIVTAEPIKAPESKRAADREQTPQADDTEREARREARRSDDAVILAYLRGMGYTGTLTADIRSLALDTLAHAATVEAYSKG